MGLFNKQKIEHPTININTLIAAVEMTRAELPSMSESYSGQYVNYGADNKYPQYLSDLSSTCALHKGILTNKNNMVAGKELWINDMLLDDWIKTLSGTTSVRVQNLFYNPKYPYRDWIRRTSADYNLFGAYSSELIWDTNFEYVKCLKHLDTSFIRSGVMNKDREITKYYFNDNWSMGSYSNKNITPISVFDPENDQDTNQIIYKKYQESGLKYYARPPYVAGITYINLDSELGLFNLSHIQNGLNPGLIFKVPFTPPDNDAKAAFVAEMMRTLKGARNKNNPLFLFNIGDKAWDIEKIELPDFSDQLVAIIEVCYQQIIFAHNIPNPSIVGLPTSGKLGGTSADEIAFAATSFNEKYIDPARRLIEETIEDVLKTHNIITKVKIK